MSEYEGLSPWQALKLLAMDFTLATLALAMMAWMWLRPQRRREDDLLEPLEVSRCPACKSTKTDPIQDDPPVWSCRSCHHEFDPMARVRERNCLVESWRETK